MRPSDPRPLTAAEQGLVEEELSRLGWHVVRLKRLRLTHADLVSHIHMALVRLVRRYRPALGSWPGFVEQCLQRAIFDELRQHNRWFGRQGRHRLHLSPRRLTAGLPGGRCAPSPVEVLTAGEIDETEPVGRALRTLSARQRRALLLTAVEGMTNTEAGAHLGCGKSRVLQLRAEALAELRVQLTGRTDLPAVRKELPCRPVVRAS
jgi:RNA polymerase sigma factor (sigma-70 family)